MELSSPFRSHGVTRLGLPAALALAWLALLAPLRPGAAAAAEVQVLQSAGELFIVKGDERTPVKEQTLPGDTRLQSGPVPGTAARDKLKDSPPANAAALYFGPGQVVTLVTGASAVRTGTEATPSYTLTGAAHLLFDTGSDGPREFILNGVKLRAHRLQLFFNGWTDPPTAQVLSGEAELAGEGQSGSAGRGQTIVLDPKQPRIEGERLGAGEPLPDDPLREWATLAGFEAPGQFRRAGVALPSDQRLRVNRNERISQVTGERIPVFEGDQLLSEDGQRVRVEFDSGDKVRLTNKAVFRIDEYLPANREKPSMLFSLLGKVRALIVSRLEPDAVRFKTGTATIGVKGTDFNMIAEEVSTVVETVEGTVGVSDPAGVGEVTLGPGMQTSVAAGALPAEPSPIPPDRLQELQSESLAEAAPAAAAAAAAVAAVPPAAEAAAPPPVAPPPVAEPPPPAPAEAPAQAQAQPPPAGDPCAQLRAAYFDSIATQTGDPLDERYLDTRGMFACAGIPRAPGADGAPADVPYHPERGPASGTASQLDETFLNDLR